MSNHITIPITKDVLVLRTDFSDDALWEQLCVEINTPDSEFGFVPFVEFLNDATFKNLDIEQLIASIPEDYPHTFIFIVDKKTMDLDEHAILCVDLYDAAGSNFRVIPLAMWGVENNLSIANMGFEDFLAEAQTQDGIFRGF